MYRIIIYPIYLLKLFILKSLKIHKLILELFF